jgi:hypothetical protein
METNWAVENLQTIRTLMERSALYRRALAPIMLFAGATGVITAIIGRLSHMDQGRYFCGLWLAAAIIAIAGTFYIARRQALKANEVFWSPPTRRVAQALCPSLSAGLFLSVLLTAVPDNEDISIVTSLLWILFYGCAVHAAGFFMPRGIKLFGWIFIIGSCGLFSVLFLDWHRFELNPHWLMGFFFGVLHLAYGAYLYLTEKKNPVA